MRVEQYTDLINEIRDSKINRIFAQSQSITISLSSATNSRTTGKDFLVRLLLHSNCQFVIHSTVVCKFP